METQNELSDTEKDKMYLKAVKDCHKTIQAYIDKIRDKKQAENYMACVVLDTYSDTLYEKEYSLENQGKFKDHLTEEDIKNKIKDKKFTILEDGKTTICNLYLENGYTVRGESACVNPANFDKALGEEIAYKNAVDKVWVLEGYLLQEKLYKLGQLCTLIN